MKKFLIIDDHQIVAHGLKSLLSARFHQSSFDFCADAKTAYSSFRNNDYNLAIMDLGLGGEDGARLLYNCKHANKKVPILIFSMRAEEVYAYKVIKDGANGFVSKSADETQILHAVEKVLAGENYVGENVLQQYYTNNQEFANPFQKLSSRELEITEQLVRGVPTASIAKKLNLHPSTVGTHKLNIYSKLGVESLPSLIRMAEIFKIHVN